MATTSEPSPPSPSPSHSPHSNPPPSPFALSLTSHETALALIPPRPLWPRIDRLRALYDKAYPKWPPHVNLIYPFVRPDLLDPAVDRVAAALASRRAPHTRSSDGAGDDGADDDSDESALRLRLDSTGVFERGGRRENTLYLCSASAEETARLGELRAALLDSLVPRGHEAAEPAARARKADRYTMHMTVAQSEDARAAPHRFLVEKIDLVPAVAWTAAELAVLVRERRADGGSVMRLWGTVGLADGAVRRMVGLGDFYEGEAVVVAEEAEGEGSAEKDALQSRLPYYFDEETARWVPFRSAALDVDGEERAALAVASYNVLAEFEWPASEARYPLVVRNILAGEADADVLVLQEVTDGFLSYLLGDERVRDAYPFCSHGPPSQDDIEPLPSFLNMVVLSKTPFDWEYVSLHRKHKGAVVARFKDIGRSDGDRFLPLVLAAVHLSHGLTDGAVAVKKTDIKRLIAYLSDTYPAHPWILAGDFNVTTSSASIDAALKKKTISDLSASHLAKLDELFTEAGLEDAWRASRDRGEGKPDAGDRELDDGEGATWDPGANGLAAAMAAAGGGMHAQRYDRILVRGEGLLDISGFNMFGFLTEPVGGEEMYASDHWGIRCTMHMRKSEDKTEEPSAEIASLVVPVHLQKAPEQLSAAGSVEAALAELGIIPSEDETNEREKALAILKSVILNAAAPEAAEARLQPVVVVPVGSYALGAWTSSSDMDVLCIGPFSSATFFALASQRLRKAAAEGIRILRRVRAHTGTMLELDVRGIKMDLQYCPAAEVAERWPDVLGAPASDPVWLLSPQTLSKLKAIRDIDYLRRSVPDLAAFRHAHRFIKTWAKSRGIYSARFGFLSGIQISILLARVHKLLARQLGGTPPALEDLITTFFAHYAAFDWSARLAFDPLFHRHRLPYTRTAREPLAVLGYFPPALNTAQAASVPSVKTLSAELARAAAQLASAPSWSSILAPSSTAAADFLAAHRSYVRLDVHYWGLGPARGAQLLGWLESRCVALLVDLQRRAPGLHARMWPARFVEGGVQRPGGRGWGDDDITEGMRRQEEAEAEEEGGVRDFAGCYLIGLDKARADMGRDELKGALGALQTALARFEAQMRADERYFDPRCCWLSAGVVSAAELGELELDEREWGEYNPGEEEFSEEDEDDEGGEEVGAEMGEGFDEGAGDKRDKKKKGAAARKQIAVADLRADKTKKFRTALDAMNRIRWDPQLDSSDYVVGYEDRFTGAQEKELAAWKSEQTDEEFIPQHRILYFRRKSDGKLVWDRRTRWDALFGNAS